MSARTSWPLRREGPGDIGGASHRLNARLVRLDRFHGRGRIPSMISQDLLDILVCPACKKPLALKDEGTSLKCAECGRVYPVRDNIPILLIDEAKVERP